MAINQQEEEQKKHKTIPESGRWTYDLADAQETAKFHNVGYQSAVDAQGRPGYVIESTKPYRQSIPGTSGADEGLLNDNDYYRVQDYKSQFAQQQQIYDQAKAAGEQDKMDAAWRNMNDLHHQAETVRAGAGYSGDDAKRQDGGGYRPLSGSYGAEYGGSGYGSGGDLTGVTGGVEDLSPWLEQMNAALKASALAELQAAYDKNVAALERTGQAIPDQYQAERNQSAGESEQAKRSFAQYAAANGLNNGTAGQAELARSIALQGDLNTLNGAEADALADLELQRANAEIEYNNAIAQAEATGDYQLASDLYQEKVRVQEALAELQIQQQKFALQQYQLRHQAQQDAAADQLARDKFDFQKWQYLQGLEKQT